VQKQQDMIATRPWGRAARQDPRDGESGWMGPSRRNLPGHPYPLSRWRRSVLTPTSAFKLCTLSCVNCGCREPGVHDMWTAKPAEALMWQPVFMWTTFNYPSL